MLIAITGGIGCGKSVVSQLLRTMGYEVYDCDSRAKQLMTSDTELRAELIQLFGADVYLPDGSLNKTFLANRIFNDDAALARMNEAIHPAVARDLIKKYGEEKLFFFESAILFESRFDEKVHPEHVISVSAPLDTRIKRVMVRDNASAEKIEERIGSQMAQEEKDLKADSIIMNDDSHSIIAQTEKIIALIDK